MKSYFLALILFLIPTYGFSYSLEYSLEGAVYRVGVHLTGGIAETLWQDEMSEIEAESSYSDGGTTHFAWHVRKNEFMTCTKARHFLSEKIDYYCTLFSPNLETTARPTQIVMSLGNFKWLGDFVNLNSMAQDVPDGAKAFSGSNAKATAIDGLIMEGDFAQLLFEYYLEDSTEKIEKYQNGRRVLKETGSIRCSEFTVAYKGHSVRTEYSCYLDGYQQATVVPQGSVLRVDLSNRRIDVGRRIDSGRVLLVKPPKP